MTTAIEVTQVWTIVQGLFVLIVLICLFVLTAQVGKIGLILWEMNERAKKSETKVTEAKPKPPDHVSSEQKIETAQVKLVDGPFQTAIVDLNTGETVVDAEGRRYKIIDFKFDGIIVINEGGTKMELKASSQQSNATKRTFAVRKAREAGVADLP